MVLGSGGHAASLIDILERENKYKIAGYIVNDIGEEYNNEYPVIGSDENLSSLYKSGIRNAAIGIGYLGNSVLREKLYNRLKKIGFYLPVACDPSAIVSRRADIGEGTFIGKGAIVNAGVTIGRMCIINTGAIVEHDCQIEDFSHISVGTVLCGGVHIGKASFVGANATVIQMRTVGQRCIIGAGTVIRNNVEDDSMIHYSKQNATWGGYNGTVRKRCAA